MCLLHVNISLFEVWQYETKVMYFYCHSIVENVCVCVYIYIYIYIYLSHTHITK